MKIYITHGETESIENSVYKDDGRLNTESIEDIQNLARYFCIQYGIPSQIKCSPYIKTKQTALIMNDILPSPLDFIYIDTRLSDYREAIKQIETRQEIEGIQQIEQIETEEQIQEIEQIEKDLCFFTSIYNIPKKETVNQFENRIINHQRKNKEKDKIIWYITHTSVLKKLTLDDTCNVNYIIIVMIVNNFCINIFSTFI